MTQTPSNPFEDNIFQVAGDPPVPGGRGSAPGYNLANTAAAKPLVLYGDRLLTVDYYRMEGAPDYLLLICPKCGPNLSDHPGEHARSLRVGGDRKRFHIENDFPRTILKKLGETPESLARKLGYGDCVDAIRGVLTIEEPIGCVWEPDPTLHRGYGFGVCNWRVVIEGGIARDA